MSALHCCSSSSSSSSLLFLLLLLLYYMLYSPHSQVYDHKNEFTFLHSYFHQLVSSTFTHVCVRLNGSKTTRQ